MTRILVRPDDLVSLSSGLKQVAGQLRALGARLGAALGSLDWAAQEKAAVEAEVSGARRQAELLAGQAEQMAQFLAARAEQFRAADGQGLGELGHVVAGFTEAVSGWLSGALHDIGSAAEALTRVGSIAAGTAAAGLAVPIMDTGGWVRSAFPGLFGPGTGAVAGAGITAGGQGGTATQAEPKPADPKPAETKPAEPAVETPAIEFQGIDLGKYFTPAEAKALQYTLTKEGGGFQTIGGSVNYQDSPGHYKWDGTLLNYGIISFAFPIGGGYGLMHTLVSDPAAAAELQKLAPQFLKNPEEATQFQQAFSHGESAAVAWWREHGMADEHNLKPEWQGLLKAWAGTEPNKQIQVQAVANGYMSTATDWAKEFDIHSERGLAFLFDVSVQQGGTYVDTWKQIMNAHPDWSQMSDQAKLELFLGQIKVTDSFNRKAPIVNGGDEFTKQWGISYDRPWQ